MEKQKKLKIGILIGCVSLLLLVAGYFILCAAVGQETIYPNVTVNGVSLGGMDCQEAELAIRQAARPKETEDTTGVVFSLHTPEGKDVRVEVPLSCVEIDAVQTAAKAWTVGNDRAFAARGGVYLKSLLWGTSISPVYADGDSFQTVLDGLENEIGREAVESSWALQGDSLLLVKGVPGVALDREALKEKSFAYMGRDDIVELDAAEPQFTVDLAEVLPQDLAFSAILEQVEQTVQNAAFDKKAKLFQVDRRGISFDVAEMQKIFRKMDWGETREVPLTITEPTTTLADLQGFLYQDTLGSCTTNIGGSENRVQNIRLAAHSCNGKVLMPGEEFSYNGAVGRRTAARGFLPAPAYVSGQSVQETGGGVCQGSSTIYLAALRSNLEIVERYNHGYITRYVPDGMDATVYYGAKDFRFQNNTPFPLKILASVSGRSLTVNIIGTKSDNITVEMTNETTATGSYKTVYEVNPNLSAGSTKVSVTPYSGYTVKVYRNLYENGTLIDTKLESTSVYKSRNQVIQVSPADAAKYGL